MHRPRVPTHDHGPGHPARSAWCTGHAEYPGDRRGALAHAGAEGVRIHDARTLASAAAHTDLASRRTAGKLLLILPTGIRRPVSPGAGRRRRAR